MLGLAYFELLRIKEPTWLHVHLRCGVVAHHIIAIGNMGPALIKQTSIEYCRSGNIREVLVFANFARMTNSRIQESRENYFCYNSATKE